MNFEGKIALVTGAASGIGHCTAQGLAALGAEVLVADINAEAGEAAAADIRAAGGKAHFIKLDITDTASIKAAKDHVLEKHGRLDVLANVAGWGHIQPFVDNDDAFVDKVMALNLRGPVELLRAFFPVFIAQKGGRVVLVSSDAGRVGSLGESVYSAAKGGVIAFSKALAREGARHGINVNCVCPGPTDTPLLRSEPEKFLEAFLKAIPLRRFGKPSEVADAIIFMASDRASYITGQVLSANGGIAMVG
ncbi:2-hydroxycyclohexanecarboxyl-CoA dehydrogenase [Rhodoblastus sphagnicola]|uniref:2-hydroxycyclohexanecarboxyl-CoA dehydrogenase n=1 Tax=Rhodoblastus sphagnicola TaxID=333368 RepID=A0A2S6MX20_9HYPH|nr:glucose 1-dehydrogenase [Rhodoblastus sphagnicola]MBB4199243.1 2-hydroxycyclohexanecarboxyl-CoA dehydrogenase [Rhodoblastus sphagnicola]PPQ26914.1 2-hydroxycyclohexanecarboxyl-CoA dehydrogenase [Rhodoblastus sphagnicola]